MSEKVKVIYPSDAAGATVKESILWVLIRFEKEMDVVELYDSVKEWGSTHIKSRKKKYRPIDDALKLLSKYHYPIKKSKNKYGVPVYSMDLEDYREFMIQIGGDGNRLGGQLDIIRALEIF